MIILSGNKSSKQIHGFKSSIIMLNNQDCKILSKIIMIVAFA